MGTEQKFKLSKIAIICTAIAVVTLGALGLVLKNKPTKVRASVIVYDQQLELDCSFEPETR